MKVNFPVAHFQKWQRTQKKTETHLCEIPTKKVSRKDKPVSKNLSHYHRGMEEVYCVIDLKSFYASCECAARGLDIFSTPLVVADPDRTSSTVVMSATPFLKERYGIPNVCRVRDLPDVPGLILAKPRMAYYLEMSAKVVSIFLDFVDEEDLHVYSVDESFLRLTPYLKMNRATPEQLVAKIQKAIKDELGLVATSGIGPNMFLAKICLDNEGKKKPPYVARWGYEDVPTKLWKIQPITKIWGISHGISSHLYRLGIYTLEALAKADEKLLRKEFGVIGLQLKDMANGIDRTDIREKYVPKETSLSQGQTLYRDYNKAGARLVLRELIDDLAYRLRAASSKAGLVFVGVNYSAASNRKGFSKQTSLNIPTDDSETLYQACLRLFDQGVEEGPIRGLYIAFGKLICNHGTQQLSLFETPEEEEKRHRLDLALDQVSAMFGRNAALRASSLTEDSNIKERHTMIGGHHA